MYCSNPKCLAKVDSGSSLCGDCSIKKFTNSAVKHDSGKLRLDLIHPAFMEQLGQAMTYGANKYSDDNYLTGEGLTYRRLYASLQRHLLAWYARKDIDPESGLPHLAHAAGALLMLITSISEGKGKDDRYGK